VEVEMMRWSAYVPIPAFVVANYRKPATVLVALRGLLGEETFMAAHREFMRRWAYRIPYPWDFFRTVEDVSGQDLGWFWRSWYYETWVLDQAVAAVEDGGDGTRVVIEDRGRVPMPVHLTVTRRDGSTERIDVPVDVWLSGSRRAEVRLPPGPAVTRVEIDADHAFPDADRANNVWPR
jgi:aminopeptidase N